MQALLEHASYMPHGYCLFWQPWLIILYAGSDLLIFLSYSAIPFALLMFLRRRPDFGYRPLVALFAAFILLCGLTHLISILTLWVPVYPLHGLLKLVTGLVSGITAIALFSLIPRVVAIPSPRQLEEANARLREEIGAHERTLGQLREAQHDLELKVQRRTAALTEANAQLAVVTQETVHRSRNLLTIVGSLARQTARGAKDVDCFLETFSGRLDALSHAMSAVMRDPSSNSASLETIVTEQLSPVMMTYGERIALDGPPVQVMTEAAQRLCLIIHELATNAQKFGALATDAGTVHVTWEFAGEGKDAELMLRWRESGSMREADFTTGTPGGGFGTRLLMEAVPAMLGGVARRSGTPDGSCYELVVPVSNLAPKSPAKSVAAEHAAASYRSADEA